MSGLDVLRTAALMGAVLTSGLGAGVFLLYAHTVMPGLGTTDDRTFVTAFAAMDRAILNPWFLGGGFFGPLLLGGLAGALSLGRPELGWVVAAVVLWLAAVVITLAVNVPLNDGLKAGVGSPDLGAVRVAFDETRWRLANLVRVGLTISAFALLTWAALRSGQIS